MAYALRPYQAEAVAAGVAYLTDPRKRGRNGVIVAPTGSGKSLLIAGIVAGLDGPCVVLQPSKEILEQNAAKLASYGYRAAIFSASLGQRQIGAITLATIGSVVKRAEDFAAFPYVLIDECHLVNAKGGMYRDFLALLERSRVLGLTATPYRLASNSFGSMLRFITRTRPRIFTDLVHATQIGDLFSAGYLSPLEYRRADAIDPLRLELNSTGADFADLSVKRAMRDGRFADRLVAEVRTELSAGRRGVLVFTRFVDESHALARAVPGAAVVTAETPARERAAILRDFRAGRIPVVSNVGVVAIGFDYPELDTVILARPTMSLALYYQQVGRAIRPHLGKPFARVVDMVGNVQQFGRIEHLRLRGGGMKGDLWEIVSGRQVLTNVYFGEPRMVA